MLHMKPEVVTYLGCDDGQARWGQTKDPRKFLKVGKKYTVREVEVHSWHTLYHLDGFPIGGFNSVCFDILGTKWQGGQDP